MSGLGTTFTSLEVTLVASLLCGEASCCTTPEIEKLNEIVKALTSIQWQLVVLAGLCGLMLGMKIVSLWRS